MVFDGGHYTAQIIIGAQTYTYDDMEQGGKLVPTGGVEQCLSPSVGTVLYLYTRTSSNDVSEPSVQSELLIDISYSIHHTCCINCSMIMILSRTYLKRI